MNKIYKVIWNKTLNCWNVTSELGKAHGKAASQVGQSAVESNPLSHFFFRLKVSVLAIMAVLLPTSTLATVAIDSNYGDYAINTGTARAGNGGTDRALNYNNPGNLSYSNPNAARVGSDLYSPDQGATGIAIGASSDARTTGYTVGSGIAIGDYSRSVGGLGISMGHFSQATNIGSTAIGTGALASGFNALSIMRQSAATDDYAMAIGNVSYAKGKGSLAMGQSSTALGNQSIAIGSADVSPTNGGSDSVQMTTYDGITNTQASADFAVAIGAQSKALKESAVALGTKAKANGLNSTAIGTESSASKKSAALGYQAKADGEESTAIGVTSAASGNKSLALGMNAKSSSTGAFAIGADSNVSGANAGAIGLNTSVAQQNTIAIGNNITSTQANSLVLGTGSTDRAATTENGITLNGTTYTYAGQSSEANGVVSVATVGKERQIINVGAGKVSDDSTDAINGSQLYAVTQELTHFYSVNSKDTTAGNYNNKGATGVNALAAGVGASATQKDAVAVGGNAKGLGELSVAVGSAQAQSSHAVAIGSAASTGSAADSAIAMGHLANADKNYTVAIGSSAKALQDSSVAIGSSAGARGNQALALGASAAAEAATATSVGANTFANGISATAISANAKANAIGDIALGANASATGRSTTTAINASTVSGERLGSAIAVGSVAKAEGRNALAIGNNAQALGTTADGSVNDMIAIGANSMVSANRGAALGYKAIVATGADNSVAIGYDTKSYSNNAVAIGTGATVGSTAGKNTSGISIGAGSGVGYISGTESVAIGNQSGRYVDGNTNYAIGSRAGNIVKGADNYAQGIEAGRVVTGAGNTAIGYASGTYVNGNHNQSYGYGDKDSGQNINGNDNISLGTLSGRNIGAMTSSVTTSNATFTSTTKSNRNIAIGYESNKFETNAPLLTSDNLAMGTRTIASGGSAMALGAGAQATGANSLALGVSNVANTATNAAGAVSNNTKASGENAIAIGHGAQASAKDTISIGTGNVVSGKGSSAVGDPSIVAGSNSFSAGNNNAIGNSTDNAFIFGGRNNLGGTAATRDTNGVISTAGGISNAVNASKSAIVGYNNSVQDQNVFVVGNNVEVKNGMAGAVVLGNDSTADAYVQTTKATVGDVEFGTFAGSGTLTPGAIVSVGKAGAERQIKNVAAGQISSTSTDVINGSQLYAVANKPMTFAGDSGTNVERKLGETLTIKGGKTDGLTENNIGVVADNDKNTLTVKLAETINLGDKGSVQTGNTKIDNSGLTITNGPSVTNTGINAGGTTITNVAKGDKDTDAVNKEQLDAVEKIAESKLADFTVLANSNEVKTVNKDDNSIAFVDGTNIKVTNDNGKVKIATANDVSFNTVTVNNSGDVKQGDNNAVTGDTVFKALDGLSKTVVAAGNNVTVSDPQTSDDGKTTTYTVNAEKTTVSAKTDGGLTVNAGNKDADGVTNYDVALSDKSKASLDKADTALQSWTAQVNGTDAKEVKSGNNKVNFVNGDNIAITAEGGEIKVSTTKAATFDTVTINNGGSVTEGSKSAVNGGDVYNAIQNTESQFKGDNTDVTVKRKPSQVLSITGGATGDATSGNIKTVADANGSIAIQLAKQLTGLSSISAESIKLGDKVEISKDGINAGGTTISNVASGGTTESNAANIGDVQKAAATAKTEVKAGTNVTEIAETKGTDGQAIYTVNANGSSVSAESALTVTKGDKDTNNVTDYKIDLADKTKDDIKKGVDAAKDIAEKGLTFTSDNAGESAVKKLGDKVAITGDKNITTVANNNGVQVTLNSNLTGLDSITTNGGVTINEKGIDAGSKTITNVADGVNGKDAVNKDQLDAVAKNAKTTTVVSGKNTTVSSKVEGVNTEYTVNAEKTTVSTKDSGLTVTAGNKDADGVTNYDVALSKASQDSLKNADTALQSWTAQVNGTEAKVVDKDNNSLNFANGENIAITAEGGAIKVATAKEVTFDKVTINNGGNVTEGSKSAVNGGDVYTAIQNTESQFTGDNNTVTVKRKPSQVLSITGGATGDATSGNIKTVADANGSIAIQLAKQLTGLSSISAESIKLGDKVEISKDGINAGGTTISKVADGVDGKDAVNKDQLDAVAKNAKTTTVVSGKNTTVSSKVEGVNTEYTVNAEKTTVSTKDSGLTVTAGNKDADGVTNYEVALSDKSKASLDKADTALQSWTAQVNGTEAKVVDKDNNSLNFVNGDNIAITAEGGAIKVATAKEVTFDNVTINNGGSVTEGSKSAVNGGDVYTAIQNTESQFTGDNNTVTVKRKPSQVLSITGGATGDATSGNIKTVADANGSIAIQLAKQLTDLTSITTTGGVKINEKGIDAGGKTITNVAKGENGTDAVNKDQLDALKDQIAAGEKSAVAAAGKNTTVDKSVDGNVTTYTVNAEKTTVSEGNGVKVAAGTKDANGVTNYEVSLDNDLVVGDDQNPGSITIKGENGKDAIALNGKDGTIGVKGEDGKDGVSLNGKDGTIGLNGKDGVAATVGVTNGKPGLNGKDGETQPRLTVGDKQVATLEDGLKFQGDKGDAIAKQLNETLTIKGNADKEAEVTDKNLRVDNEDGNLIVKMAKELKDLASATFGDTVINHAGVTVNNTAEPAKSVSLTKDGLNNGGNQIKNVASGLGDTALADATGDTLTNAANIGDVKNAVDNAVDTASKDAFGLTDDNDDVVKQDLGKQIKVKGDGSITTKVNADEKALELALAKDITVGDDENPGSITIKGENGKDAIALNGKDGTIGVKGEDGKDGVTLNGKDGTIGLNGKDGATTTVGVTNGKPGLNGKDGETQLRLTVGDKQVATLEDGLKFQGDKGDVIAKQLNETLTIKGSVAKDAEVTDKNLRVDNEDGNLIVKMAKELKELTSATFGNTVINNGGVTVNNTAEPAKTVSLTKDGLNNGGNQIKNVASGLGDTALAEATGDTLTNAANIGDVKNAAAAARTEVKAGTNVASVVAEAGDKGQTIYTVNANGSSVTAGSELISVNAEKDAASNITDYKIDLSDKAKQSITAAKTEVKAADGESNLTVTPKTGANGQAIYEVALSKDLAVDSLQAGATKIDGNGLTVGDVAITADGIRAGDNKIIDVAAGTVSADSKDAVNGGQLFNQGEGVKNIIGGNTVYNPATGSYTNNNIGGTGKDNIDDAIKAANDKATQASKGWNLSVNNGVNKGNIAPDASVDLNNSDNNIVISKNGNNVTFDLNKDLAVSNLTADNSIKVGDVAVTKDGINAGNTVISNVQAAEVKQGGSDAATTGQLYNNSKSVADALGGGAAVDSNGNITAPSYTITQTDGSAVTANSVGGALNYFNREVVKPITFTADSGTHDAKLGTTVNVKGSKNISTAMSGNTLTISMTDTPEFSSVTTGNTQINNDGVLVRGGENGVVALTANGLNNGGNRITNVAPGVEGTDAVNVNQLNAVSGNLNKRIDSVDKHARGGIAGALATAGLYQAYLPGHSMVSVGAGTYRGENALAIGVSRVSDNGKIGVKLSGMSTSQGDLGGSVSVGYQW